MVVRENDIVLSFSSMFRTCLMLSGFRNGGQWRRGKDGMCVRVVLGTIKVWRYCKEERTSYMRNKERDDFGHCEEGTEHEA